MWRGNAPRWTAGMGAGPMLDAFEDSEIETVFAPMYTMRMNRFAQCA